MVAERDEIEALNKRGGASRRALIWRRTQIALLVLLAAILLRQEIRRHQDGADRLPQVVRDHRRPFVAQALQLLLSRDIGNRSHDRNDAAGR